MKDIHDAKKNMHGDPRMPVVLVSISDDRTMDNYALFEESVLHRLAVREDVKVVALIGTKVGDDLQYSSPTMAVERVTHSPKLSRIQRIVQFLYSYLLFTDTTYLVSSLGARTDVPRTLLQDVSYPFKWLYAQIFGRMSFMRNHFASWIYLKTFTNRPYKQYFDRYNPDLVFLPNMCRWPADIELLAEAKRGGIRTIGVPRNWDHMSKYFVPFKLDTVCLWSESVKEEAVEYQGYNEEDIVITGSPQVDFILEEKHQLPREEFLHTVNFPSDAKVVLYASQGVYSIDGADYVDMMLRALKSGTLPANTYFIIRPYPGLDFDTEKLEKFRNHEHVFFDVLEHADNKSAFIHYLNIIKHSDVAVTSYSSVYADTALFDTPCIVTNFDGYKSIRPFYQSIRRYGLFTHVQSSSKTGGTWFADSREELLEAIGAYLRDPALHRKNRKELVKHVFGYADGHNSERVFKVIEGMLHRCPLKFEA